MCPTRFMSADFSARVRVFSAPGAWPRGLRRSEPTTSGGSHSAIHVSSALPVVGIIAFQSVCSLCANAKSTPGLSRRADEPWRRRSEEHTSELQSRLHLVCRLLLEKKKNI